MDMRMYIKSCVLQMSISFVSLYMMLAGTVAPVSAAAQVNILLQKTLGEMYYYF